VYRHGVCTWARYSPWVERRATDVEIRYTNHRAAR
jgi:hypothetical protein